MTSKVPSSLDLHHEILILDVQLKAPLDETKMREITSTFVDDLMLTLKMAALGPLEIYPATDLDYPGWSFIQPITTSHISGHYFIDMDGQNPNIHLDVYSCKIFQWKEAIVTMDKHLQFGKWSGNLINRSFDPSKRSPLILQGEGTSFEA